MVGGRPSLAANAVFAVLLASCTPPPEQPPASMDSEDPAAPSRTSLQDALSFHASFDNGPDADFARGDGAIYTAPSYDALEDAKPGIGNPDVQLVEGVGRFGGALDFTAKNGHAIFYSADDNVAYDPGRLVRDRFLLAEARPLGRPRAGLLRPHPAHGLRLQRCSGVGRFHQGEPSTVSARGLR